ncbi:MAG: hypothetical protein KDA38_07605 [Planctomycetales bacterium]|nr:hypothetical protein [Planctomycetales bacterium]
MSFGNSVQASPRSHHEHPALQQDELHPIDVQSRPESQQPTAEQPQPALYELTYSAAEGISTAPSAAAGGTAASLGDGATSSKL